MDVELFHIHGDNIVECERMIEYVLIGLDEPDCKYDFESPACPKVSITHKLKTRRVEWDFVLFPGFNKSTASRWETDIYEPVKDAGGFLDETPDAVISRVRGDEEEILFAVEFCSALQAGNQAWQRSGRAASTARSGCPYLYVVGFVNYELKTHTRERKALRFPNPAIPYSYISYSFNTDTFAAEVFVRAEEFSPSTDERVADFDTSSFGQKELVEYIVAKLAGQQTEHMEKALLDKCLATVQFLSRHVSATKKYSESEWQYLYDNELDVIDYAVENSSFSLAKKIAKKSAFTPSILTFRDLVKKYSKGISSNDFPIGVIPCDTVPAFVKELEDTYPFCKKGLESISATDDLVVCLLKGFKPKGDDNRPDRGALPLAGMLAGKDHQILTFIYGPILSKNLDLLINDPLALAKQNGLWKSFLSLSNYVLLDAPVLKGNKSTVSMVIDNQETKNALLGHRAPKKLVQKHIAPAPVSYQEDDVDTALHILFSRTPGFPTFECSCNPPGGDWSGISIQLNSNDYRWVSLPRKSHEGAKRPDHITLIEDVFEKPLLLITESKGVFGDLEENVGFNLIAYLKWLMKFPPSVFKEPGDVDWKIADRRVTEDNFCFLSAAAYISKDGTSQLTRKKIFAKTACDLLFEMNPQCDQNRWAITIVTNNDEARVLAEHLVGKTNETTLFELSIEACQ